MDFVYYTDTPVKPYNLARIKPSGGSSPDDGSFVYYWSSPAEVWNFKTGSWKPSESVAMKIFGTGDWEQIDESQVEEVMRKIREFYLS